MKSKFCSDFSFIHLILNFDRVNNLLVIRSSLIRLGHPSKTTNSEYNNQPKHYHQGNAEIVQSIVAIDWVFFKVSVDVIDSAPIPICNICISVFHIAIWFKFFLMSDS